MSVPFTPHKIELTPIISQLFPNRHQLFPTRPIYHRLDATIRGHVFCSFLALVLRQELQARLERRGHTSKWADVIHDLDQLQTTEVQQDGERFLSRNEAQGTCGSVFQTAGVALPPTVQQVEPIAEDEIEMESDTPIL